MRIDIHGTFLMSGRTTPLPSTTRRRIRAALADLLRAVLPDATTATVTVSEDLDECGAYGRQCVIAVQRPAHPRLVHAGCGRTLSGALDAACANLARSSNQPHHTRPQESKRR